MTRRQGYEGHALRFRKGVSRAGQAGADAVRRQGPAVGRGLAELSALEAEGGDERQDPRSSRTPRAPARPTSDRLRRSPELPDRLRVLQRRRPRRPGARPALPQGHQRRRQGRPARPRARRPRLGRLAPHRQQLRPRSGRRGSTSRKAPSITRRSRRPTGRRVRCANGGVFRYEPRDAEVRCLRHLSASPIRTATSSTAGARTSSSTAPAPIRITAPCSPAISTIPRSTPIRRRSISSGPGPAPAWKSCQPALPRAIPGQSAGRQRHRLPGHLAVQDRGQGRQLRRHRSRADPLLAAIRTSGRRTSRSGPDGAIWFIDWHNPIIGHLQHALRDPEPRPHAWPHLSRHLRGPAAV